MLKESAGLLAGKSGLLDHVSTDPNGFPFCEGAQAAGDSSSGAFCNCSCCCCPQAVFGADGKWVYRAAGRCVVHHLLVCLLLLVVTKGHVRSTGLARVVVATVQSSHMLWSWCAMFMTVAILVSAILLLVPFWETGEGGWGLEDDILDKPLVAYKLSMLDCKAAAVC